MMPAMRRIQKPACVNGGAADRLESGVVICSAKTCSPAGIDTLLRFSTDMNNRIALAPIQQRQRIITPCY